ncbi:GRAM domain containing protein, putative [Leishmania guyanensis]|uniref:GRAM domain-containing protein n=1 Tax=Leishmania guyanensis TaxID=5670 RepID=A0A1E1J265_LEIGU|nr:hypothetical protein, conserved [Leishmania guyanensis]
MSTKSRAPVEIQKSFVQQVQNISAHTRGISDELALMSQSLRDSIEKNPGPTADLLAAASQLSSSTVRTCMNLCSCLHDLGSMGEAAETVLAAQPELEVALLLNFFGIFATQMSVFFKEMDAWWDRGCQCFSRSKAAFLRELPASSTLSAADIEREVSAMTSASTTGTRRYKENEALDDVVGRKLSQQHDEDGKLVSGGTALKKARKKAFTAAEAETSTVAMSPRSQENFDPSQNSHSSRGSTEDTMIALAAAAESGAQTAAPRRPKKKNSLPVLPVGDAPAGLMPEELSSLALSEPLYLLLTSTLEEALGAAVMAARPNVFSNLSSFTYNEPVATYYVRLVRPGSLAYFVYCNYIRGSVETQDDFLCDVLETDCAEVDPFVSPAGEVIVDDPSDLSSLPACAWGCGSSEDNERRLYTMYALVTQPSRVGPTAIIQDSLNMGAAREEVLHMVALVDGAPDFARVTCMVQSEGRPVEVPNQKQAAIITFSRSGFVQAGFVEVPDSEVEAAVSHTRLEKQSAADAEMSLFPREERGATTTFQPPVQLASLDQPSSSAGISFGGVARGAVQGGYEVLKAPFTVGRAVGGALLDVTGVTDTVRNNIEGLFRRAFPDLVGETVVDSFNCAWMERSIVKQGYLFITRYWVCFQSTVAAAHFSIEYDEIKDIVKCKSVKMFANAIEIKTHLNDTIFLTNFLQRDQAYDALMSQWLKQ